MERKDSGTLIAFEGIDGAGKTTQVDLLVEFFRAVGESPVRSKEPTDGPWGQKIRASASNGRMSLDDEIHAFTSDRKQHVQEVIQPALAAGGTVILDRYFYSSIAYQGSHGGDVDELAKINAEIAPQPDVVFLLDVPPEVGLARIRESRGEKPNAFETIANLKSARAIFQKLSAEHPNIQTIQGAMDPDSVKRHVVWTLIEGVLKKRHCAKHYGCDDPLMCLDRITGNCRWFKMRQEAGEHYRRP